MATPVLLVLYWLAPLAAAMHVAKGRSASLELRGRLRGPAPALGSTLQTFMTNDHCQSLKPKSCNTETGVIAQAFCSDMNMAYIREPKVNSKGIKQHMIDTCPGKVVPHEFSAAVHIPLTPSCAPYTFTFVRDPFERTVSAYAEIDAKTMHRDECVSTLKLSNASFWKIDRGDEPRRFEQFLDDIDADLIPEACQPDHARSQTAHVCDAPKGALSAIGQLDYYEEHLALIESEVLRAQQEETQNAGGCYPNKLDTELEQLELEIPSYSEIKQLDEERVLQSRTSKTSLRVCEMFKADYVCFGFALPDACA